MRTSHKPNFSQIRPSGDEIWQLPVPKVQVWNGWTWPSGFFAYMSPIRVDSVVFGLTRTDCTFFLTNHSAEISILISYQIRFRLFDVWPQSHSTIEPYILCLFFKFLLLYLSHRLSKMSKNYTLGTWIYHFSGRVHPIWLKFGLWVGLLFLIGFIEVKKTLGQLQPFQIWTLGTGSCHISSPDGPI